MKDINSLDVTGRVGGEIKLIEKQEKSKTCCKFSLAINTGKDKAGKEKDPIWISCTAFGGMAIWLAKNRGKGDHLLLKNAEIEGVGVSDNGIPQLKVIVRDFPMTIAKAKKGEQEFEEDPDDIRVEYNATENTQGKAAFAPADIDDDF